VVWHDLKAHHLAHQTFADTDALDRAIHQAVDEVNAERGRASVGRTTRSLEILDCPAPTEIGVVRIASTGQGSASCRSYQWRAVVDHKIGQQQFRVGRIAGLRSANTQRSVGDPSMKHTFTKKR
jgi:hypothetical protein